MNTRSVEINVTRDDIRRGKTMSCRRCPVALALKRALHDIVEVGPGEFRIFGARGFTPLPLAARQFIARFDGCKPVKPFSFFINVPTN